MTEAEVLAVFPEITRCYVIAVFTELIAQGRAQRLELLKTAKYGNSWKKYFFGKDHLALTSNNIANRDTKILSFLSHKGQSVHSLHGNEDGREVEVIVG